MAVTDFPAKAGARGDEAQRQAAEGDLREFLRIAAETGELEVVEGADPHLEIGALYELSLRARLPAGAAVRPDQGLPAGHRILCNVRTSHLLDEGRGLAAVQAFRARKRQQQAPTDPARGGGERARSSRTC